MEDFARPEAHTPPNRSQLKLPARRGPPLDRGRKCKWMNPKALESKRDEGWGRVAKRN